MNYYAVERSTDHLAHYGVKGMRWGVRKALVSGNERALNRHYRKAAKKLAKLQDIGLNSKKYAAKSAAYGAAAAGTGTLAAGGINMLGNMLDKPASLMANNFAKKHNLILSPGATVVTSTKNNKLYKKWSDIITTPEKVKEWGNKPVTTYKKRIRTSRKKGQTTMQPRITNNDLYRIGAGAVTAGLLAKSAQNAYRATHGTKYREKAVQWKKEMDDAFYGTPYQGHYEKIPRKRKQRR